MSKFYGTLQGQAGEATRRGSISSGIRVSAQSYDGSVITRMKYDNDTLKVIIETSKKSSNSGDVIFNGTYDEFVKMCESFKRGN